MRRSSRLPVLLAVALLPAAAPPVTFTPLEPRFEETTAWYRQLWRTDGARIIAALERESGFAFPGRPLEIILRDGRPMTGYGCSAIRLRGTYTGPTAVGTLIHELGHCLTAQMPRTSGLDDHRLLYLFLYDAWTSLYGRDFADRMVRLERRIPTGYDYDAAWTWALAMTREERKARLRGLATPLHREGRHETATPAPISPVGDWVAAAAEQIADQGSDHFIRMRIALVGRAVVSKAEDSAIPYALGEVTRPVRAEDLPLRICRRNRTISDGAIYPRSQ